MIEPALPLQDAPSVLRIDVEHASAPWSMVIAAVSLRHAGFDWYEVAKTFRAEVQARQMAAPRDPA